MMTHRGSIRDLLQRAGRVKYPNDYRPYNSRWSFDRERHERGLRAYIEQLRWVADALEAWLDRKPFDYSWPKA